MLISGIITVNNCKVQFLNYRHHLCIHREKNADLKNAYDKLERRTLSGPNNKEFEEDKVQALWRIAQKADFNREELESLKVCKYKMINVQRE